MDTRYPYTYAADYVRGLPSPTPHGVSVSRADASAIVAGIAEVLGITAESLAEQLADAYLARTPEQVTASANRILAALNYDGTQTPQF
jgi:hypothetical protein